MVFPEQVTGVAGHPVPDGAEPTEDLQSGLPLGDVQPLLGDAALVSQGPQDLAAAEPPKFGMSRATCSSVTSPKAALRLPEHAGQVLHRLLAGVSGSLGKVADEVVPARLPSTTETEEPEQVPELDGMHLHRCGRQQQERPALRSEFLHQAQKLIRAPFLRSPGGFSAGVMGLVQDDQVPVFGLEQIGGSVATPHEMAGGEYERLLVPLLPIDPTFCWPLPSVDLLPDKLLAVIDRDVEVELLVELVLPLGQQRLGHEDQDSSWPFPRAMPVG